MFITSYQRFLEHFDYGFINWNVTTQVGSPNQYYQPNPSMFLFSNSYALHRQDSFVVSNDFKFASLGIIASLKIL